MTDTDHAVVRRIHEMLRSSSPDAGTVGRAAPSETVSTTIDLPYPRPLPDRSLGDVLQARRSTYRFADRPLRVEDLADLLAHACGPQRMIELPSGGTHVAMTAPSAGGLPSTDVHCVDLTGSTVPAGVHRYNRREHRLEHLAQSPGIEDFGRLLTQPQFTEFTASYLILTARLDTTLTKYPARHYRTLHVDTGVLVSTLYLVATALGMGCCAVTGFYDDAVDDLLGLDDSAFTTAVIPIGYPEH